MSLSELFSSSGCSLTTADLSGCSYYLHDGSSCTSTTLTSKHNYVGFAAGTQSIETHWILGDPGSADLCL